MEPRVSTSVLGRWRRVEEMIDAALDLPSELRDAYLRDACEDDSRLCAEAVQLLHAGKNPASFLQQPLARFTAPPELAGEPTDGAPFERIGPYRLLAPLGRGGMGTVFLAERSDFAKQVALKLVQPGLHLDPYLVRRFLDERQILARLDHPHIARLLDGGVTECGIPYYVMEYVDGERIDRYCDRRELPVERRLALFRQVCEAVLYAHRNLVIHRDLKPSNVLVTNTGEVKLLDFGIAKLLAAAPGRAEATQTGVRLFTPEYASPEQVRGEPVTPASDVFALGILLYELLTGRRPHRAAGAEPFSSERAVLEHDPPRPSRVVLHGAGSSHAPADGLARARATTPARLSKRLAGDLDAIVLQALRKEPERRHPSAEHLHADIERHLQGLPVSARPDRWTYRTRKFIGRHRRGMASATGLIALLVAFGAVTRTQADRIEYEREQTAQVAELTEALFALADPSISRGEVLPARELLDRGVELLAQAPIEDVQARADLEAAMARRYIAIGAYEQARPLAEAALAHRRRTLGTAHPDVARSLNQLGLLRRHQGDFAGAEAHYREALAIHHRLPDPDEEALYLSLNGLAFALRGAGQFEEAASLYRRLIEQARREGREAEALDVQGLAASLYGLGDYRGAEFHFREALEAMTRLRGATHPDNFVISYNLGEVLHESGALQAADSLYRATLAADRRVRGESHPLRSVGLYGWGYVRRDLGDLAGADSLFRAALDLVGRSSLDRGHPRTARILIGLGSVRLRTGRAREAEPLLRQALAFRERALAAEHWHLQEARLVLGACLSAIGRFGEAEPLLLAGYGALRERFGEAHPRTRRALEYAVRHYRRAGQWELANLYRARLTLPASL